MSNLIEIEHTEPEDDSPLLNSEPTAPSRQPLKLDEIEELKMKVYIGELHNTFLRLPARLSSNTSAGNTATPQPATSHVPQQPRIPAGIQVPYPPPQAVRPPYPQTFPTPHVPYPMQYNQNYQMTGYAGRISIAIIQANLTKNYGITRMDPYCRLTIGQAVYETPTHLNGAKAPSWNKTVHCQLPHGVVNFFIEIFDEKSFSYDEKIAWAHLDIPPCVFQGTDANEWFPLSGKMGDAKEGMIFLGFKFQPATYSTIPQAYHPQNMPVVAHQQRQIARNISSEQLKQLKEMFPNLEDEVVKSILASQGNDYDKSLNILLTMSNDN